MTAPVGGSGHIGGISQILSNAGERIANFFKRMCGQKPNTTEKAQIQLNTAEKSTVEQKFKFGIESPQAKFIESRLDRLTDPSFFIGKIGSEFGFNFSGQAGAAKDSVASITCNHENELYLNISKAPGNMPDITLNGNKLLKGQEPILLLPGETYKITIGDKTHVFTLPKTVPE